MQNRTCQDSIEQAARKLDRRRASSIRSHYNSLDPYYRDLWGEHLHHGLWLAKDDTAESATDNLTNFLIDFARVEVGESVCDIGCGYGASTRAIHDRTGSRIEAYTLSEEQYERARSDPRSGVRYHLKDFFDNDEADESFDLAFSLESLEHIAAKRAFFAECKRILKPGGRVLIATWMAAEGLGFQEQDPSPSLRSRLLRQIEADGLVSLWDDDQVQEAAQACGLQLIETQDLTSQVARTWTTCAARLARRSLLDPRYRRFLLSKDANRSFALAVPKILLAYRCGAMRYRTYLLSKELR